MTAWQLAGLCRQVDPDLWFPEKGNSPLPAKRICAECPVIAECRAEALARNEPFGVWGGLSAEDRKRLRHAGQAGPLPVVAQRSAVEPSDATAVQGAVTDLLAGASPAAVEGLTYHLRAAATALLCEGRSPSVVAEMLGVTPDAVYRRCRRHYEHRAGAAA